MKAALGLAVLLAPSVLGQDPVVQTKYGAVQGRVNPKMGNDYFFGIPFAAPPTGNLRYAPPQAPSDWKETKVLGTKPEPECAQANSDGVVQGQEDCLTLDLYRPHNATAGSGLAVMAWIYGGGFVSGDDDAGDQFNGDSFAANHNTIVVAMNYRLGSLGFLALESLMGQDGTTGNYGLLDQQFALKWINENIHAFGGDPAKVTIFGESAGACSVVAQLAMPASQPYFRAAIAESSLPVGDVTWVDYKNATKFGELFADWVGCSSSDAANQTACMRALPVGKALEPELDWRRNYPSAIKEYAPRLMPVMPYFPVIDGTTLPMAPLDLANAGKWPDKPFIIGTNKDEGTVFSELSVLFCDVEPPIVFPLTARGFRETLLHFFNATTADQVEAFYGTSPSYTDVTNTIIRDYMFACPSRRLVRSALENTPQRTKAMYMYQFAPNLHDSYLGDYHGSEINFVFNHSSPTWTKELHALSTVMHSFWASLANDQVPHCETCPVWTAYNYSKETNVDNYMEFATPSRGKNNLLSDACDFWDKIGYQQNP